MKAFTLPIIFGLLATVCHAAPSAAQPQARQVTTLIIDFFGAGANPPSYEIDVPLASSENFQSFNISNPLSVSSISVGGPGFCIISGIDGSSTLAQGGGALAVVAPPQVQVSGVCSTF